MGFHIFMFRFGGTGPDIGTQVPGLGPAGEAGARGRYLRPGLMLG